MYFRAVVIILGAFAWIFYDDLWQRCRRTREMDAREDPRSVLGPRRNTGAVGARAQRSAQVQPRMEPPAWPSGQHTSASEEYAECRPAFALIMIS